MKLTRRSILQQTGAAGLWFGAGALLGWRPSLAAGAFDAATLDEVVKALGGTAASESTAIDFKAPEIAENGAVVPVEVTSSLPGTRAIALVVAKNPHPLSANFRLPEGTDPYVSTRIKIGETSDVFALVQADGGFFTARRVVKVTLGGCGG